MYTLPAHKKSGGLPRAATKLIRALVALAFAIVLAAGLWWPSDVRADDTPDIMIVPLINGTVSGWLVDFASERNYMLNTYLEQLDALDRDPDYSLTVLE